MQLLLYDLSPRYKNGVTSRSSARIRKRYILSIHCHHLNIKVFKSIIKK